MLKPSDLFDLSQTAHASLFDGCQHAWEALKRIESYVRAKLQPALHNRCEGEAYISKQVYIGAGTVVEDGAMIKGPAIIGENCVIRHNAYIREHVIIGDGCRIGNSSELKHAVLFNDVEVPHFNYVGDSILGFETHLGAGAMISNLKLTAGTVVLQVNGQRIDTGLRKFGALVGDHAEIGCNAVLSPGSIIGRNSVVYPCVNWRGVLAANSVAKNRAPVEVEALRK
jgi:NDP-sugar pyrophosphorylase family protein